MANIQFLSTFSTYNSNYDRIYVFRNGLRNIYEGISFVMTAMFVVIFMDQWLKEKNHTSSLLGLGISFLCLLVFGPDSFMIPTMILIIVSLTLLRKKLDIPDQKLLATSSRQMCFWKNEVAIKNDRRICLDNDISSTNHH